MSRWGALCLLGLQGCQQPSDYTVPVAEKSERVVRFCGAPGALPEDVPADFEARTGIRVVVETADSMEDMMAELIAEPMRWDVLHVREYLVPALREWHLLAPLDFGKLPGLKNLDWRFLDQPFDPGNRYSLPSTWGITVLAYRTDKMPKPPVSWTALWDDAYAGHIVMPDDPHTCMALALLGLGYLPDTAEAGEWDAAGESLKKQARLVKGYLKPDQRVEALVKGDCWLTPLDGCDIASLLESTDPVRWVVPAEGGLRWINTLAVLRDAEHQEEAYAFLDYLLEPRPAAQVATFQMSATPNKAAEALVTDDERKRSAMYPDSDVLSRCRLAGWDSPASRRVRNSVWPMLVSNQPAAWAVTAVTTNSTTP